MSANAVRAVTQGDQILDFNEACDYLEISPRTLRRRVRERRVRHIRDGHLLKFHRADLDDFRATQIVVVEPTPVRSRRSA